MSRENRSRSFKDTPFCKYVYSPLIYEPGVAIYTTDEELEAKFSFHERSRLGSMDMKWAALRRDGRRCCRCGRPVKASTSQLDHIKPVEEFASFREAHFLENVQTLCLNCHKLKTSSSRRKA